MHTVKVNNTSTKIFDRKALLERLCDDEDLLAEVMDVFLADTPNQIQTLKEAHLKGDQAKIVHQGHTIKGSSSNVSALRMRQIAHEIEQAGKSGEMESISSLLGELEEQFREFQDFLAN